MCLVFGGQSVGQLLADAWAYVVLKVSTNVLRAWLFVYAFPNAQPAFCLEMTSMVSMTRGWDPGSNAIENITVSVFRIVVRTLWRDQMLCMCQSRPGQHFFMQAMDSIRWSASADEEGRPPL